MNANTEPSTADDPSMTEIAEAFGRICIALKPGESFSTPDGTFQASKSTDFLLRITLYGETHEYQLLPH